MRFAYDCQRRVEPTETLNSAHVSMNRTLHNVSVNRLTSYGKFRASGKELEIMPARRHVKFRHDFNQISDCSALDIESMVCLDGLIER